MAKLSTAELLEQFKGLTLIELSEFVKAFEETFEVTAAAPVSVAAAPGAGGGGAGEVRCRGCEQRDGGEGQDCSRRGWRYRHPQVVEVRAASRFAPHGVGISCAAARCKIAWMPCGSRDHPASPPPPATLPPSTLTIRETAGPAPYPLTQGART